MKIEIERKYLLSGLPRNLVDGKETAITQGYLSTGDPEVRIREKVLSTGDRTCFATSKSGKGLARMEEEFEISYKVFSVLFPATTGRRIKKSRYQIQSAGLTWEVDQYHEELSGLFIAEVELPNSETEVVIPEEIALVLIREVTEDPAYKNKSLAEKGLPTQYIDGW